MEARTRRVAAGVLAVLMVGTVARTVVRARRADQGQDQPAPPAAASRPGQAVAAPRAGPEAETWLVATPEEARAQAERAALPWGRDVFAAPPEATATAPARPPDVAIEGTVRGDGQALAIIDDAIVRIGGAVGDWRLTMILDHGVILERDGQQVLVPLPPLVSEETR